MFDGIQEIDEIADPVSNDFQKPDAPFRCNDVLDICGVG